MIDGQTKVRKISAKIQSFEKEVIKAYIKGAVYSFCNNCEDSFSVIKLFGKENRDWYDTPLQLIYDYYKLNGKTHEQAASQAAKDVGLLLKEVLKEDKMFQYEEHHYFRNEYVRLGRI